MKKIKQERLKEVLHYSPDTGIFTWRNDVSKNIKAGCIAGSVVGNGYVHIGVDGGDYQAHRLAFLYVHGYFPENNIDHCNRVKSDNRINNLREVSQVCNVRNTCNRTTNTSGVKGVCWYKKLKTWRAQITVNGEGKHCGYYKDFADAVCARLAAEQCLNWSGCDNTSPAFIWAKQNIQCSH